MMEMTTMLLAFLNFPGAGARIGEKEKERKTEVEQSKIRASTSSI